MSEIDASDEKIIEVLVDTEFVTQKIIEGTGKENVPEFLLTKFLVNNGETELEKIKEEVDHPLAAVALKNLLSADLVEENNDVYSLTDTAISQLS